MLFHNSDHALDSSSSFHSARSRSVVLRMTNVGLFLLSMLIALYTIRVVMFCVIYSFAPNVQGVYVVQGGLDYYIKDQFPDEEVSISIYERNKDVGYGRKESERVLVLGIIYIHLTVIYVTLGYMYFDHGYIECCCGLKCCRIPSLWHPLSIIIAARLFARNLHYIHSEQIPFFFV